MAIEVKVKGYRSKGFVQDHVEKSIGDRRVSLKVYPTAEKADANEGQYKRELGNRITCAKPE